MNRNIYQNNDDNYFSKLRDDAREHLKERNLNNKKNTSKNTSNLLKKISDTTFSILNIILSFLWSTIKKIKSGKKLAIITFVTIPIIIIGIGTGIGISAYIDDKNKEEQFQAQIAQEEEQARLRREQAQASSKEKNSSETLADDQYNAVYDIKPLMLKNKKLNVPLLYQNPELEAGCECVALTNMLNYYKFNISKTLIVDKFLEYDNEDWVNYYVGDPRTSYNGCTIMSPGLTKVANKFLQSRNSNLHAYNISGRKFEDLFAYIERGNPVQIWSSLNMDDPGQPQSKRDGYDFYIMCHSVVINGFDRDKKMVYITDSINGNVSYSFAQVKRIYEKINSQAVVIVSNDEVNSWMAGKDKSYDDTIKEEIIEESNDDEDNNED